MTETLKTDIYLTRRAMRTEYSDRMGVNFQIERGDLVLVSGRSNMAQAIVNRLFAYQGELTDLGNPDYGSRLHLLLGEPNNSRTRSLAELYIREALGADDRIKEVYDVKIAPPAIEVIKRNILEIEVIALLEGDDNPIAITTSINLEV